jgi:hypothetical protein
MAPLCVDSLTARVERLERESRRWRRLAAGSWLLVAALGLLGQAAPPRTTPARPAPPGRAVEAERFVLRDARGRVGAVLGWADDGPRLALYDAAGQPRAALDVGASGAPRLTLLDADGRTLRAALLIGPDGAPGLALFDAAARPRLAVALFAERGRARAGGGRRGPVPAVAVYDETGAFRATLGLLAGDVAGLDLADGRGGVRIALGVQPDGAPGLVLRDADGRGRAALAVLADGTPALNLNAEDGRARAALTLVTGRGAALALADRDGAVVWSAP